MGSLKSFKYPTSSSNIRFPYKTQSLGYNKHACNALYFFIQSAQISKLRLCMQLYSYNNQIHHLFVCRKKEKKKKTSQAGKILKKYIYSYIHNAYICVLVYVCQSICTFS